MSGLPPGRTERGHVWRPLIWPPCVVNFTLVSVTRALPALRIARLPALQDRHGGRIVVCVTQAKLEPPAGALLEKCLAARVEDDEGLAGFFATHFNVLPSELSADAGAERFGDRFFGRKPRGEKRRGITMGEAIGDFSRVQHSIQKPFAEFFVGRADAGHFDDVDAGAQNHDGGFGSRWGASGPRYGR